MAYSHEDHVGSALTGSKTPSQDLERIEEDRWGITARKSPIGSTNPQWGMKPPLREVLLYQK
ncbi:hypothetical protein CN326_12200 [Bacillus sp. AFS018417]|nr:hypothetical protein CN326_12200 [Bacillus sp. AFS018417]